MTVHDVWDKLFRNFGKPAAFEVWEKFNTGEYPRAAQCITEACATVENANPEAMLELFRNEPLRPGFIEFVKFCKEEGISLTIVSDGFSIYIREIFEHNKIDVPYYTNTVELTEDGRMKVEFPYARESCRFCGACKCGTILTTSGDEDTIVYIGDGYSDHCPVEMSDIIFARTMLSKFCEKNNIPYHPFENFYTIKDILKKNTAERPKYKRLAASKKRAELYKME